MLSFLLTALTCGFAALCYAEFAAMVPISGSAYTYAYASLGELVAWIIGWDLIVEYAVGNIGVAIGWSGYFRELLSHFGLSLPAWLATDFRSAHMAAEAVAGGATDASSQYLASAIATARICSASPSSPTSRPSCAVAMITVRPRDRHQGVGQLEQRHGAAEDRHHPVLLRGGHHADQARELEQPRSWAASRPTASPGISAGAAIIFFSYIGFDATSTAAEEAQDPARDMPFGIIMSLVICTVLYILVVGGDDRDGALAQARHAGADDHGARARGRVAAADHAVPASSCRSAR